MTCLQVECYYSADELRRDAARWNDLWQRSDVCAPTMRAEPLAIWLEHFAAESGLCALAVFSDGRLVAALPLIRQKLAKRLDVMSLPCRWSVSQGDLLLDPECDQDSVLDQLISALGRLPTPLLWLEGVPVDEQRWKLFVQAAKRQNWPVDIRDQHQVGQVEVDGDWDSYFAGRSSKHRGNRRNEARRLRREGATAIQILSDIEPDDVEQLLTQGFSIEQRSWKATASTAVMQQSDMAAYFFDLARELAAGGYLHLMFLNHRDVPIAFSFGWQAKGVSYGVKIGCDADYRKFAPGHQLMMESLQQYHQEQSRRLVDFVGPAATWHLGWATRTYRVGRIVVALPSRWSRTVFYLYSNWQPRVRRLAASLRVLAT